MNEYDQYVSPDPIISTKGKFMKNEWISVKDRMPEMDCVCVVWNKSRPFQYYISIYNKYFNEFEVNMCGSMIKLPDPITFNATHWMPLPKPPEE